MKLQFLPHPTKPAALVSTAFFLICSATCSANEIKHYKYKLDDRNWLPVFRHQLNSLSENNGTGYTVVFNDDGQYINISRYINGQKTDEDEYGYSHNGRLISAADYNFPANSSEKILSDTSTYEWVGDIVKRQKIYNLDAKLSKYCNYTPVDSADAWTCYFGELLKDSSTYITQQITNGVITHFRDIETVKKYYDKEKDPYTGLLISQRGYINDKYDFHSDFQYSADGILSDSVSYDKDNRKYGTHFYDQFGRRIESRYNYTSGTNARYQYTRNTLGHITSLKVTRNQKPAYAIRYVRDNVGRTQKSLVYKNNELVAEYPCFVQFLDKNGNDKEGRKGKIIQSVSFW